MAIAFWYGVLPGPATVPAVVRTISGTLPGILVKSSGMFRSGAEDCARRSAERFGTDDVTTYSCRREVVSEPLMLRVAGSQVQRPSSPRTDSGAYGAGR